MFDSRAGPGELLHPACGVEFLSFRPAWFLLCTRYELFLGVLGFFLVPHTVRDNTAEVFTRVGADMNARNINQQTRNDLWLNRGLFMHW